MATKTKPKAKAKAATLYCSFCRRSSKQVEKLVGGPGVYICDACIAACVAVLDGDPGAGFGGWGSLDDDTLLGSLRPAGVCMKSLDDSIRQQVSALRERGVTWQRIADELAVTRQAAQQRFGD